MAQAAGWGCNVKAGAGSSMLFNSYEFLFAYLPLTLIGCFVIHRQFGREDAIVWLVLASLFYYGWWDPAYLGLILASIAVNFAIGRKISGCDKAARGTRWLLLTSGVIFESIGALLF